MRKDSRREIAAFAVLGASAFLWMSLLSHDPRDVLSSSSPARNACGPVGAFFSFHLMVWLGKTSAFGLATLVGAAGLVLLFRRRVAEWGWKVLGGVLLLVALSTIEVAFQGRLAAADTLPGGYYGQFFHGFLLSQLSASGTYLFLGFVVLVALLISTDTVLYPVLARTGGVVFDGRRWQSLAGTLRHALPRRRRLRDLFPKKKAASRTLRSPNEECATKKEDGSGNGELKEPAAGEKQDSPPPEPRPPLKIRVPEPTPPPAAKSHNRAHSGPYRLPPLELLAAPVPTVNSLDRTQLEQTAAKIEETLGHFKIDARVVEVQKGPTITQYEVSPAAGIKVHKIINLSDDLAMALKAQSIRIVAPIPGKSTVGIEVPNKNRSPVGLREVLESPEYRNEDYKLPLILGKDVAGNPVIADLGEMPHLLIAGSTGSGKSVCINSIIVNLLMTRTPEEVKLILVDPKMVELAQYENIPHLLAPVVTDMKKAPAVLGWMVDKMEERYELFAMAGVRHLLGYNALGREKLGERLRGKVDEGAIEDFPDTLPFMVVIIDELADLMMTASKEVETSITRLSQKSRAVGIHVILATQRPSVDVITGLIKANMPSRISFHVASRVDSRTILDRNGAEKLLGKGDMLYLPPGTSALRRVQGAFISDREIRDVVNYAVQQAEPQFSPELTRFGVESCANRIEEDDLYEQAVRIVLGSQRGSATLIQRQLQIGYTRASRLMEMMHEQGLVGPFKGSKAREVYYTLEDWEMANAQGPQAAGHGGADGQVPSTLDGGAGNNTETD